MRLSDFAFTLPQELIAQDPVVPRDQARLLVYHRLEDRIEHQHIYDLPQILQADDTLVVNNSKVRHARLYGKTASKKLELLVLEPSIKKNEFRCLVKGHFPDLPVDFVITKNNLETSLRGQILQKIDHLDMATYTVVFKGRTSVEPLFEASGEMPLPPYIKHSRVKPEQYQPVFAKTMGSAAAPTAGLHFTSELIQKLKAHGVSWAEITLHVGLGTFLPLRQENIPENHLHPELTSVGEPVASKLNQVAGRIIGVGSTSTRTLESHFINGKIVSGDLVTEIFIYPGYVFQVINGLLTNFHLPKSSLLLLVAAFIGNHPNQHTLMLSEQEMTRRLTSIYQTAIADNYRFYSFGDAMLIL